MKKGTRKKLRKDIRIELKFDCHLSYPEHAVRNEFVRRLKGQSLKKRLHKNNLFSFLNPKLIVMFMREILKNMF